MKQKKWVYVIVVILIIGLSRWVGSGKVLQTKTTELQIIAGRDDGQGREAVYQMQVPATWIRQDPLPKDTLADTTKPLCEYIIAENEEIIRITIHNFPSMQIEDRIPPAVQVARWEKQFEILDHSTKIPQSFSGYSGLLFMGEGIIHHQEIAAIGWSLQLGKEHYRNLMQASTLKEGSLHKQMQSDVTIKAVGPKKFIDKHRQAIIECARTFELIREIPTRP